MSFETLSEEEQREHMAKVAARACGACAYGMANSPDMVPCSGCYGTAAKVSFHDRYLPAPAEAETVSVQVPKAPDEWKYTGEIVTVVEPNSDNPYMLVRLYVTRPIRPLTNGELLEWAVDNQIRMGHNSGGYWARGQDIHLAYHWTIQDALRALIAAYEKAERSKP